MSLMSCYLCFSANEIISVTCFTSVTFITFDSSDECVTNDNFAPSVKCVFCVRCVTRVSSVTCVVYMRCVVCVLNYHVFFFCAGGLMYIGCRACEL